jgi:hypothetical protein
MAQFSNEELAETTNLVAGQRTNARGNSRVISNCLVDWLRVRVCLDIAKQTKRRHWGYSAAPLCSGRYDSSGLQQS